MSSPVIILCSPQMQENIGATARAMANFGLKTLRLVTPRHKDISAPAYAMASGADDILDQCEIFDDIHEAVHDIQYLLATTARHRELDKPVFWAADAAKALYERETQNHKTALLFGAEATGLQNDQLILADGLVRIPTSADFSSLNLGQSVLLLGYEYLKTANHPLKETKQKNIFPPATKKDTYYFLEHLTDALDKQRFFYPAEKKNATVTILKNLFTKAELNEQEVKMMRGVIKSLTGEN